MPFGVFVRKTPLVTNGRQIFNINCLGQKFDQCSKFRLFNCFNLLVKLTVHFLCSTVKETPSRFCHTIYCFDLNQLLKEMANKTYVCNTYRKALKFDKFPPKTCPARYSIRLSSNQLCYFATSLHENGIGMKCIRRVLSNKVK